MHYDITQMGSIIREARKAKGMTQATLADATETTTRTIIAIEKNQRHPTYEVFYKIIRTLDISADYIFWPERVSIAPEQEQIIREFLACAIDEQEIISETVRAMIRAMRKSAKEKAIDQNRPPFFMAQGYTYRATFFF